MNIRILTMEYEDDEEDLELFIHCQSQTYQDTDRNF